MIELGKVAYEAYCRRSGGVSLVSGAKLPTWEELKQEIRSAWDAGAQAVAVQFSCGQQNESPTEVTDDLVSEVEELVGMGGGAWDTINPKTIISSVISVMERRSGRGL